MPYSKTFAFVTSTRILSPDHEGVGLLNLNGQTLNFRWWDYGEHFTIPNLPKTNVNASAVFDEVRKAINLAYAEYIPF